MADPEIIAQYVEKIYAYAINHTYSAQEADELSQEILLAALQSLAKLRDADRFEPWLWGVAANVTKSFRRSMGKQRAMYSYDMPEELPCDADEDDSAAVEELYGQLREKIAMLSRIYREITILYYYDGLSTKQIAARLNIPEGTVTWCLSEARKKLKKECVSMKETALRPVRMNIGIYGSGNYNGKTIPFPSEYIDDALSQNILYQCYDSTSTVEELAKTCGVPAYYIEDRIENLLKREAILEVKKGAFRTNFIIWTDKYGIYCEENAEKSLMPLMGRLLDALNGIANEAWKIDFYKAEKTKNDLWTLFGAMAFEYVNRRYNDLPYPPIATRYDGYRWAYIGRAETDAKRRIDVSRQHCANLGSRGDFSHTVYGRIPGTRFRRMMYDTYINACTDILYQGRSEDTAAVADAVRDGYIVRREDGSFFVTTPSFMRGQKSAFDTIAEEHLAPLMPEYSEIVHGFVGGYKKLFPAHLQDDADRMCHLMFVGLFSTIADYALRTGVITPPTGNGYCDVMVQHEK